MPDPDSVICHRCGRLCAPGNAEFYVVRIEAFADPTLALGGAVDTPSGPGAKDLIERASAFSEQELMDQVYRRLELILCTACYQEWIEAPAG